MYTLTKSDFLHYRACRKSFWLARHKPDALPKSSLSDFDLMLMNDGYAVEEQTRLLVRNWADPENLKFQATYTTDQGLLVRADLVRVIDENTIDLFEVKSSTSTRGHLEDAAFQLIAIERSGITVRDINIIHVDKTYIRNGDVDAEALLSIVNVNDEVRVLCPNLERDIDDALAWVARETINENGCECRYKGSIPNHCAGFDHFNPDVPAQSIYLLPNIRSGRIKGFVDNECLALEDVQDDEVTLAMLPILQAAHAGIPVINRSRISEFLRALSFPLYFYDYETFKSAVPIMNGVSPHQQVPVQVSVHKLHIDGTLEHSEFLAKGPGYRRELLQSLRQSIGDVGHCVSWSKSFEIGRNKELAKDYPEYSEFLDSMNDRTVDLMEVFKRDYVDIRFKGSTSIKNVLPVVCPHLSYENMAVGNGGTAMAAWLSMSVETDPVLVEKKRKNLLEYCKLDTYAMVEIYRFLLGVI